jgi:hypothetical protein
LERVFADCFEEEYRTRLEGGALEPLYQPAATPGAYHILYYREDYFASALHEIAHWCIAGDQRRELTDFGYWYAPDGRTAQQQRAFEKVEYKPQAMEWHFARACGIRFRISADNLDNSDDKVADTLEFKERVLAQALHWQEKGLPHRAACFVSALRREFGASATPVGFSLAVLD